jgi:hypothetical protein
MTRLDRLRPLSQAGKKNRTFEKIAAETYQLHF